MKAVIGSSHHLAQQVSDLAQALKRQTAAQEILCSQMGVIAEKMNIQAQDYDGAASPLVAGNDHGFVVQTDTPQFFTSTTAASALLETLMAFVIADAEPDVIENIRRFHERRVELGIYEDEPA